MPILIKIFFCTTRPCLARTRTRFDLRMIFKLERTFAISALDGRQADAGVKHMLFEISVNFDAIIPSHWICIYGYDVK